jgi:hypothetical protein
MEYLIQNPGIIALDDAGLIDIVAQNNTQRYFDLPRPEQFFPANKEVLFLVLGYSK